MNLPNKLTVLRVVLIPLIIAALYYTKIEDSESANYIALGIFAASAFTDFLDGYIARKYNQVTTFGKFMDPLADKLLTTSVLLVFIEFGYIETWMLIVIIAREFIVSGIRLVASSEGKVIAASNLGKIKTVFTMIGIIIILAGFLEVGYYTMLAATILTIISGLDYVMKNRKIILESI